MTPYQEEVFNELGLFRVVGDDDRGSIVWLINDDGSSAPQFSDGNELWYMGIPGNPVEEIEELPKDADGFYLWEGGERPVPGDWEVTVKFGGGPGSAGCKASRWAWEHCGNGGDITAFKPVSRPDMPRHSDAVDHAETDPSGRNPRESGAKLDAGKNRLGLIFEGFPRALQMVGEVGTYGAQKYTDNGWRDVPNGVSRYTDAMYRHLLAEAAGELCDKDTALRHAAHAAWNALARLELALIESESLEAGE